MKTYCPCSRGTPHRIAASDKITAVAGVISQTTAVVLYAARFYAYLHKIKQSGISALLKHQLRTGPAFVIC